MFEKKLERVSIKTTKGGTINQISLLDASNKKLYEVILNDCGAIFYSPSCFGYDTAKRTSGF